MSGNNSNSPWCWSTQDPTPNDINSSNNYWASAPPPPQPPPHPGYGGYPYGFRPNLPPPPPPSGNEGYGNFMDPGFAFNHSIPPPPFNCPPNQFPLSINAGQQAFREDPPNFHSSTRAGPFIIGDRHINTGPSAVQMFRVPPTANANSGQQSNHHAYKTTLDTEPGFIQHEYPDLSEICSGPPPSHSTFPARDKQHTDQPLSRAPLDEKTIQQRQDEQWIRQFLQRRTASKIPESEQPASKISASQFRETLYSASHLVSKLSLACDTLKQNIEDKSIWAGLYCQTQDTKNELEEKLILLNGCKHLEGLKSKLLSITKRRARIKRRKLVKMEELAEEQFSEKEAAIDKWRMKQIQAVEEKKREQELKLAADSVLCEVRKKQADVTRMQDILRSLEKLRKLRKEAASRKGIFPDGKSEQEFDGQLERLRVLIRKRTSVYGAEENTLRVMLEGEQEEERRQDLARRQEKERERQLQRKRDVESMLFGDDVPADPRQQPFREYYTRAERSLLALVHIRREWDIFLVPTDHTESSTIPQGWVLPEPPSDHAWASALA